LLNKVFLIGRLGKDPEFRVTQNGSKITKFTLATDERRKNDDGSQATSTEWHRVIVWNRLAEVARDYLRKGSLVFVEARIHYDSYENQQGQKVYTTELSCLSFKMLEPRRDSVAPSGKQGTADQPVNENPGNEFRGDDENLPF
jgi:single-strand DNA-binding protein